MAQLFQNVLPGDLITADQMNRILDAINSLTDRVGALEGSAIGGSAVIITDLIPPSGSVQAGAELRVLGRNFGVSRGAARAYIDDTRVLAFKTGTDDEHLVFDIPAGLSVPQAGRAALLTVTNQSSSAQRTLSLLPAVTLSGDVDVSSLGTQPQGATPTPNAPLTFAFRLRSRANLDATFAINATVAGPPNASDWQNQLQVLDQNQAPLLSSQIPLAAGQQTPFFVRISQVPPTPAGTPFTLTVNAGAGAVAGSSGPVANMVGTPAPQPDTSITMNPASSQILQGTGTIANSQIKLAQNAVGEVVFQMTFTTPGIYDMSAVLLPGATNWDIKSIAGTAQFQVTQQNLNDNGGIVSKLAHFSVAPKPGATSGGVQFKAKNQAVAPFITFPMTLVPI